MKLQSITKTKMVLMGVFLFVLFGLCLIPYLFYKQHYEEKMSKWPKANATIIDAEIVSFRRKHEKTKYKNNLIYKYSINGITYTNKRIIYAGKSPEWDSQSDAAKHLPEVGSVVSVYFNPDQLDESVIYVYVMSDSELHSFVMLTSFFAILGLAFIYIGVFKMDRRF